MPVWKDTADLYYLQVWMWSEMATEDFRRRAFFDEALDHLNRKAVSKRKATAEELTHDCLKQWAIEICENVFDQKRDMSCIEE